MKIGILGGTFDPVHRGHGYVARRILEIFDLERVLFMVSNVPPHKEKQIITSALHRYAMVVLEIQNDTRLCPSPWELERREPPFTIDTLDYFATHHPQHSHCFIAGTDALKEIHLWKDYVTLLTEHCFIFVQRPGIEVDPKGLSVPKSLREVIEVVCEGEEPAIQPGRSFLISLNTPSVSSTSVRKLIASGKSPSCSLVSSAVLQYIQKNRLYEENEKLSEESLSGD